jgi:hypothetical protein
MAFIKLDDALQVCSEAEDWYTETNEQHCAVVADDIYQQIANIPTADVVEVVRCKDCRNRYEKNWSKCTGRRPDDFCSDGKRKEGD